MRTVFFDVDTQLDFLFPAGALYVPGAERLLPALARLTTHALARGIPLVSTVDAHAESDAEFRLWPPHCVKGTLGQRKAAATLAAGNAALPNAAGARPGAAPQYLVEKQALDAFTNVNLRPLIAALGAERCVVYGVVTEYCVRCAALGLLELGKRVELVTDAIETLRREDSERALEEIVSRGGVLTTLDRVTA